MIGTVWNLYKQMVSKNSATLSRSYDLQTYVADWLTNWLWLTWPTLTTANKGPAGHFKDKAENEDDNEDGYGDDDNDNDNGASIL